MAFQEKKEYGSQYMGEHKEEFLKTASQGYLNKKLYTNKPTKDYFYQFNTGSR